jgi:methylmalonyl-CoA mutase
MAKAIETGMPKLRIEEAAARKQARIDRGEDVIVGVNKYQPPHDDPVEVLEIDNRAVREAQIARLERIRASRDDEAVREILGAITACAGGAEGNLLELSASRRCAAVPRWERSPMPWRPNSVVLPP